MEYTKGEWKYTRPQIGTSGKIICTMVEPHYMPDCGDNTCYNGQVEVMNTDAHLIAAAPDMYEALKAIQNNNMLRLARNFTECGVLQMISDALSKAESKK